MSADERSPDIDPDRPAAVAAGKVEKDTKHGGEGAQPTDDKEALRAEIEQTRAELGETVEALSAKADVKAQVKDKVEENKAKLRDQQVRAQAKLRDQKVLAQAKYGEVSEQAKANPAPFAAAAGGVVALLLIVRRLRRRS